MTWALFDMSYFAHRALHTMGRLSHTDIPTGIIFGCLEQLRTTVYDSRVATNKVALFFDSSSSYRQEEFPGYKRKRHENKTPEELEAAAIMRRQITKLRREIMPAAGFPCYRQAGVESDDLMADAAKRTVGHVVIVTGDNDLWQCITGSTHWFDPARNMHLDVNGYREKTGLLSTIYWGEVKAISGCSSDCVPGIRGVGEKTAIRYILGALPKHTKAYRNITSTDGMSTIERNLRLVRLPHAKTRSVIVQEPVYNPGAFFEWCRRLGIQSYLRGERHNQWVAFFEGRVGKQKQTARRRGALIK